MSIVPVSAVHQRTRPPGPVMHPLREPCRCGHLMGTITPKGGQDLVYCGGCGAWLYNAPRSETGAPTRPVRSRPKISPSQRARVFDRDNHRCVLCGTTATVTTELHLSHLVSVADAREFGLSEEDLWHDENLIVSCAECNLGLGRRSVSARLIAALVMRRAGVA